MILFGHHIEIEILGKHFSPEGPMEHALWFGGTALAALFMLYGAYALGRDWLRRSDKVTR
jgi:hypothetical protein